MLFRNRIVGMCVAQQVPRLMLNNLSQRGPIVLGRHPAGVELIAEDERLVARIPVPNIHFLGQTKEGSILRKRGAIPADIYRGIRKSGTGPEGGKADTQLSEASIEC